MNTATLPDNPAELKALFLEQKERYESRIEFLEERVRLLSNELFPRSSEKRPPVDDPRQLHLFNEAEELSTGEKAEVVVPGHTRVKPKRKPLPDHLPRIEVIHDLEESEKVCAWGATLSKIGEEVSEKLDTVPARVRVIRHIRPKYACKGCEGVESGKGAVKIVPSPPRRSSPRAATVVCVETSKACGLEPCHYLRNLFEKLPYARSEKTTWLSFPKGSPPGR